MKSSCRMIPFPLLSMLLTIFMTSSIEGSKPRTFIAAFSYPGSMQPKQQGRFVTVAIVIKQFEGVDQAFLDLFFSLSEDGLVLHYFDLQLLTIMDRLSKPFQSDSPARPLGRMFSCQELTHFNDCSNLPSLHHRISANEPATINVQADNLEATIDHLLSQITKLTSEFVSEEENVFKPKENKLEKKEGIVMMKKASLKIAPKLMHSPSVKQPHGRVMITPKKAENPEYKGSIKKQRRSLKIQDFELGKNIGSGKFGDVFQCKHKRTGALFAIKKIFKSMVLEYNMIDQFTQQIKILYSIDHPNIVKLYGHFDDKYHIFLLMEYLEDGMLMNYLKKGEVFVGTVMRQISRAVAYIHRFCIAHRDIKPENILYSNGVAKLCDFGWAANCDNRMRKTFCGTLDYVSPEILEHREYSLEVDLWSLGVLCYQLIFGVAPFNNKTTPYKIPQMSQQSLVYPDTLSDMARDFIERLLVDQPDLRMSALDASRHPLTKTSQHPPAHLLKEFSNLLM